MKNYTMSNKIEELRRQTPLNVRLRVLFEMEWLSMNINPSRTATDEEIKKAEEWSDKMVKWIIADIKEWESDGRPGALGNY